MDVVGIFILVCVVSCVFCLAIDFVVGRRKYRRFVAKVAREDAAYERNLAALEAMINPDQGLIATVGNRKPGAYSDPDRWPIPPEWDKRTKKNRRRDVVTLCK